MLISKATGVWGNGADEAYFHLEAVGNTPQEVSHLESIAKDLVDVEVKFENGALKVDLVFERRIPLEEQAKLDAEAKTKADAEAKAEEDKRQAEAQAKADEEQKELRKEIVERSAQILADNLTPKPEAPKETSAG